MLLNFCLLIVSLTANLVKVVYTVDSKYRVIIIILIEQLGSQERQEYTQDVRRDSRTGSVRRA